MLCLVENWAELVFQAVPREALSTLPRQPIPSIPPEISGPINRPFTVGLDILIVLVRNMGFGRCKPPVLVLAVIWGQNGVLSSIAKESIRYGTETMLGPLRQIP